MKPEAALPRNATVSGNKFFRSMRNEGKAHRKELENAGLQQETPLFSNAQHEAFKFWAVAEWYNASDIYVDTLPSHELLEGFIGTFRDSEIGSFVLSENELNRRNELEALGCSVGEKCTVIRSENKLYKGPDELIRGVRIYY